jgi:hypothetical protein
MLEIGDAVVGDFFYIQGRLREKQDLEEKWGVPMNWAEYFRLRGALVRIQREFRVEWESVILGRELEVFIQKKSKGCGRYRRIISGKLSRTYTENDPREIVAMVMGGGGS